MENSLLVRRRKAPDRREFLLAAAAGALLTACSPPKYKDTRLLHPMGERVFVGALTYIVLETKWSMQVGEAPSTASPAKQQFLQVRLSVTNGGGETAGFPMLSLINTEGETIPELDDAKGLPDWMGLIRNAGPGQSELGWILFDVPQAPYVLQLSDGKIDNEQTALVDLPFRMG
jgi:Domain of unknown function (DUF4352)